VKLGLPRSNRVALIERDHDHLEVEDKAAAPLPLYRQAELLGISRSSLYYRPVGPSQREIALKNRIDEIYTQYPFYGYRRIHQQLLRDGLP